MRRPVAHGRRVVRQQDAQSTRACSWCGVWSHVDDRRLPRHRRRGRRKSVLMRPCRHLRTERTPISIPPCGRWRDMFCHSAAAKRQQGYGWQTWQVAAWQQVAGDVAGRCGSSGCGSCLAPPEQPEQPEQPQEPQEPLSRPVYALGGNLPDAPDAPGPPQAGSRRVGETGQRDADSCTLVHSSMNALRNRASSFADKSAGSNRSSTRDSSSSPRSNSSQCPSRPSSQPSGVST